MAKKKKTTKKTTRAPARKKAKRRAAPVKVRARKNPKRARRKNPARAAARPGSVVVALANPIGSRFTERMARKRARKSKKRSNPRRRRHTAVAAAPRRRRHKTRSNPRRHGRRRRRNPGMGPWASVLIGAAVGAGVGAGVDYAIEHWGASLPDMAKTGIKVAGAAASCVLGAKHPAMAAGAAAGLLAPEATKLVNKIAPSPATNAQALAALYDPNMGAIMDDQMGMGAVGYYDR